MNTKAKSLTTIFKALDALIDQTNESMPLRQALALLSVAIHEEQGELADLREVGKDTGAASAVVSRDLLGLGKRGRTGKPGLGLIAVQEDYTDLRRRPYGLTPKGRKAIAKVKEAL